MTWRWSIGSMTSSAPPPRWPTWRHVVASLYALRMRASNWSTQTTSRRRQIRQNIDWGRNCRPNYNLLSAYYTALLAQLTPSLPIPLRFYTLPYWPNPPFIIFDIRVLWRSGLSIRAPECQKLKIVGYTSMALNPLNSSSYSSWCWGG